MKLSHAIPLIAAMISGMSIAADPTKKTCDFGHSSLISTKGFSQDTQHASTDGYCVSCTDTNPTR